MAVAVEELRGNHNAATIGRMRFVEAAMSGTALTTMLRATDSREKKLQAELRAAAQEMNELVEHLEQLDQMENSVHERIAETFRRFAALAEAMSGKELAASVVVQTARP